MFHMFQSMVLIPRTISQKVEVSSVKTYKYWLWPMHMGGKGLNQKNL